MTPTLFLLVGLPGSGKTTLARRLEAEHAALRLICGERTANGTCWSVNSCGVWPRVPPP